MIQMNIPNVDFVAWHPQPAPNPPEGIHIFSAFKPTDGWLGQVEGERGNRGENKSRLKPLNRATRNSEEI